MLSLCELSTASSMAHRVDGVLVGYPIATPSLRISTRVPRDQKGAWPKLTRACVPRTDGTVNGTGHIQVCIPVELSPHSAPLPTTTTKLRPASKKTGFTGRAHHASIRA